MAFSGLSTQRQREALGCAIYTKSIAQSPVVSWILHTHIRHSSRNDAVFVGEDFVQVKQVAKNGHLHHIATKADFEAHVTAAAVLKIGDDDAEADFRAQIKREHTPDDAGAQSRPSQLVVLTLDSGNLLFLGLTTAEDGRPSFVQCAVPLPHFDRTLFQPGQHLAVDPYSRAVAVAARQDQVVLYGTKPKSQVRNALNSSSADFCPVSVTRPFKIDGVIQHMNFLAPSSATSDHVILLLIIIDRGRTKAARIEWSYSTGPLHAQLHPAQVLDESGTIPTLLIPLRDASFLLVTGNDVTLWKDILSGSATELRFVLPQEPIKHPGLSSCSPIWANWARPCRSNAVVRYEDGMYLVREDGVVIWITIKAGTKPTLNMSRAGDFECHVGTAFASLGDEDGPDILTVAGETSTGCTVRVGPLWTPRNTEGLSREEAMRFEAEGIIPNWASATDMISAKDLHAYRYQSAHIDGVFVTSGRQPYGTVTEIRRGLEARISVILPWEGVKNMVDLWVVPDRVMGSMVMVLSSPMDTRLLSIEGECEEASEIDDSSTAFDLSNRTLKAGVTANGCLVQVTVQSICVTSSILENFEDVARRRRGDGASILAAEILHDDNALITAEDEESGCGLCYFSLAGTDNEPNIQLRQKIQLATQIICVAATKVGDDTLVLAAMVDGTIASVIFANAGGNASVFSIDLPRSSASSDAPGICDNMAILQADEHLQTLLVICGLRDGRLVTLTVDLESEQHLVQKDVTVFRDTTVKIVPLPHNKSAAYASCETSICLVSWDGDAITIESIWLADKSQPDMAQPRIVACAQTPQAMWLSSSAMASLLVVASDDELFFASLQRQMTTVPRQIPVDGTPNRLIYAETLRNIVCSSLFAGVRSFPSTKLNTRPGERRQIWPVIQFIPGGKNMEVSCKHHLQPGDRVNALLEWSYKARGRDKTYSFILVGGRHLRRNGQAQGRVTFLQPRIRKHEGTWEVESVADKYTLEFTDEVFSMARLDDCTIVVCAGELVQHFVYREESSDWQNVLVAGTQAGLRLASPGISVTNHAVISNDTQTPYLAISTARDSLVVLDATSGAPISMGPHAQNLLCHHVLQHLSLSADKDPRVLALLTTKNGEISGLSWPARPTSRGPYPAYIEFICKLPRSLTRLVQSTPPRRNGARPSGIVSDRVLGCATDGALVALAVLDLTLHRRLWWLQRLVEWSPLLSPHAQETPLYNARRDDGGAPERGVPIGLASGTDQFVPVQVRCPREQDYQINGDVLGRVLVRGGIGEVKNVMTRLAQEEPLHAVGSWIREHMDEEMKALEEVVALVRGLERWIC